MRIRPWLVLPLALLFLGACILPAQPTGPDDDDDDDTGGDDDDTGDDDTGDDDTGDDDTGDDDTGDDDTGDDDTGDDDTGDDDTGQDFPTGDFRVIWGWAFGYPDPSIGAEFGSYDGGVTLTPNNGQFQIIMFLFDENWDDLCLVRFEGLGTPMVPQYPVGTAGWNISGGEITFDQCYENPPGTPYPQYAVVAPDPAAMADIESSYGISVAEQIAMRDSLETDLGVTASGYFMFWGTDPVELTPLGFLLVE